MSTNIPTASAARDSVILVVDDSWPERARLKVTLQRMGHKVYEACDGHSALEMSRAVRPDIIISDWVMPGMNGLDLCHALQADHHQNAHIMMLTGRQATADIIAGIDAGADDFHTKPIASDELRARIQAVLRRRQRSQPSVPAR